MDLEDCKNNKVVKFIPEHIAIITDGNGRWATKRGLPRSLGHKAGGEVVKTIIQACLDINIKILTIYAFSSENWSRPDKEVTYLMKLFINYFKKVRGEAVKNNIKFRHIGSQEKLSDDLRKEIDETVGITKNNNGMILNIALNYGGRLEILETVKKMIDRKNSLLEAVDINEKNIEKYLYTEGLSDPDLFIRTGGEARLSNFLLWQLANTELWFTPKLWPDFTKKDLIEAIIEYNSRTRY